MDSITSSEPKIVKAKFIVSNTRIYTLEFDQSIEMKQLKSMIQSAAHLKKNNFRLYSDGQEYTNYNDETFDTIFPNSKLVVFNLEKGEGEEFDEGELCLQINSPCPHHIEKFLLYYCYDCDCSICCDCFTIGDHIGHHFQDKCYYLLSSKFLVEKMFESWSKNPYEDFKVSVDLTEFKNKINNVLFVQLFQMMKDLQNKCNDLIDCYNKINLDSLGNIRDSVRDIKVGCVKALDEIKERISIKDIISNQNVFKEFDIKYKQMAKEQKEKFEQNLIIFHELNLNVSKSVSNLIEKVYNIVLESLRSCLSDEQYTLVKDEINEKYIPPVDRSSITKFSKSNEKKIKSNPEDTNGKSNLSSSTIAKEL